MSSLSEDVISPVTADKAWPGTLLKGRNLEISTLGSDAIPPAYSSFDVSFASVSLHMTDRIRFLQFPDSDLPRLTDIVAGAWSNGIQSTREYAGSFEIKLKGNPWTHAHPSISPGDNQARRLIRILLEGLYNMGWVFDINVRTCRKPNEKDTLLFVKHPNRPLSALRDWFVISYDYPNILNIQRGPIDFAGTLSQRFGKLVTKTVVDDSNVVLTLKNSMWVANGKDTVKVRSMLLATRETLEVFRCGIYASLTMQSGSYETDVLICNRRSDESAQNSYI